MTQESEFTRPPIRQVFRKTIVIQESAATSDRVLISFPQKTEGVDITAPEAIELAGLLAQVAGQVISNLASKETDLLG